MFPGLVIWNEKAKKNVEYEQLTAFVAIYHAGVDKLLTCERELRNAIGMYCGDKDRDLSDTGKVVTHLP